MRSPVAASTPSRTPRPLPRRSGAPITVTGISLVSAAAASRVPSVPSALTISS